MHGAKTFIAILGTQGLARNAYSTAEIKVLLAIVKYAQEVITKYSVKKEVTHEQFVYAFTPEQRDAGHIDVIMKLSELGLDTKRTARVRNVLDQMAKKPISIPFKVGNVTYYREFPSLFTCETYPNKKGCWMVTFRFSIDVISHFYGFDKGKGLIDLRVINQCRSRLTMKLYLMVQCWAIKGNTRCATHKLQFLFFGKSGVYNTWKALETKCLKPACDELKRLYDKGVVHEYVSYDPCFATEQDRHSMPVHITFTLHDRRNSGMLEGGAASDLLKAERIKLKLKLIARYGVKDLTAKCLSDLLELDLLGELDNWFFHKDYYIGQCKRENRKMNTGGYIAQGLAEFFREHKLQN